ncbi:hypothetical protein G6F31_011338 [Rhizopus arrhizus]|nr:hypothetical protein G6F31_011338 [Rhizopus arrhizus]
MADPTGRHDRARPVPRDARRLGPVRLHHKAIQTFVHSGPASCTFRAAWRTAALNPTTKSPDRSLPFRPLGLRAPGHGPESLSCAIPRAGLARQDRGHPIAASCVLADSSFPRCK